ncbi:predicted protein [Arabidopsis lyrata subsp. lyrata]|uniref:Predicted protein n=1 Tax=Arabidopsis lyrata subsp. lyrata TaxID=81972 RepID=D7MTQ3_ARALL|nr:predicted protein [Arabidopsis lyrata subsp. lyrata]
MTTTSSSLTGVFCYLLRADPSKNQTFNKPSEKSNLQLAGSPLTNLRPSKTPNSNPIPDKRYLLLLLF